MGRRVKFATDISRTKVQFVIRDEGEGCRFLSLQAVAEDQDDFETGRNRGLKLMRHLMDDVHYNEAGNEVKLSFIKREPVT